MIDEHHGAPAPSPWIVRLAHLVAPQGRVLDLACGSGRHARFFAARGHPVLAIDRDAGALSALAATERVEARCADLEGGDWPLRGERFAGIVVANYLHRPLLPHLAEALDDDGVLLYETFAAGNEAFGRPARPDFLLQPGELARFAAERGLLLVAFEQGVVAGGERHAVVQRLAAVAPGRRWPPVLRPPGQGIADTGTD